MTKTFERFLRTFSDEDLVAFERHGEVVRPPYWRLMSLALRIEAGRRGLRLEGFGDAPASASPPKTRTETG